MNRFVIGLLGALVPGLALAAAGDVGTMVPSGKNAVQPAFQQNLGIPSNIRNSQTSAYAAVSSDCGKTIAMSGGQTGAFYQLTINTPSSYTATCQINLLNEDTARAKFVAATGGISFNGVGSGTSLTVTGATAGTITNGMAISGTGILPYTIIATQVSGTTGGNGVYSTNFSTTVNGAVTGNGLGFYLWPKQAATIFNQNGVWQVVGHQRWLLPQAGITVYSDPSLGSDVWGVSDGLAPGAGAFKDIQNSLHVGLGEWDWDGAAASDQVNMIFLNAPGATDTTQIHLSPHDYPGAHGGTAIVIDLNGGTLNVAGAAIQCYFDCVIQVRNGTITTSVAAGQQPDALQVQWGGKLYTTTGLTFGALGSAGSIFHVIDGGHIEIDNSFTVTGGPAGGVGYVWLNQAGYIETAPSIVATLASNVSFTQVYYGDNGYSNLLAVTWALAGHTFTNGSGTTVLFDEAAVLGATNFPGWNGSATSAWVEPPLYLDLTANQTNVYMLYTQGLALSGGYLVSLGMDHLSFQPGQLAAVTNTKGGFTKISHASTVDNIIGSATAFTCSGNPTVTLYECGTSTTCAAPTTIGSATVTASGTAVSGSVTNPAITAGDYIAWAISSGTCTALDLQGTAQTHAN